MLVDGRRAGLTAHRDCGDQRVFYRTEIDEAHAGQGLAAQLVQQALTEVRALGWAFTQCAAGTDLVRGRSSGPSAPR
ncbi:GNAT family N-acetyltransferase [Streptomyces sp. NPDC007901]|uniref:GNAT family N-acetyltransferase n=1 Tax=Streptomyces sp. NPDC007901 TaxID=3364785 RepID=UPI0036EC046A